MYAIMLQQPVHLQRLLPLYVALASLDVLLTAAVLSAGGREVNVIANWFIEQGGHTGMTFFKFSTVFFVLVACEFIARRNLETARRLALCAIAINSVPVMSALLQLSLYSQAMATMR